MKFQKYKPSAGTEKFSQEDADYIREFHSQFPDYLVLATELYPPQKYNNEELKEVWASKNFVVLVFRHNDGSEKINIHRTEVDTKVKRWRGEITWDELMELKRQCGRGDKFAIEIFPQDRNIIDTNNIRHLWILEDKDLEKLSYPWVPRFTKKSAQNYVDQSKILKNTTW